MASQVLLSNFVISQTGTSPAVNFAGIGGTNWSVNVSLSMPVGTAILYTVESALSNAGPWTEVHRSSMIITDGTKYIDKHGVLRDPTLPVESYSLNGAIGSWFRADVLSVTGTVTILNLTVVNV